MGARRRRGCSPDSCDARHLGDAARHNLKVTHYQTGGSFQSFRFFIFFLSSPQVDESCEGACVWFEAKNFQRKRASRKTKNCRRLSAPQEKLHEFRIFLPSADSSLLPRFHPLLYSSAFPPVFHTHTHTHTHTHNTHTRFHPLLYPPVFRRRTCTFGVWQ